jgi:AraC-like DNA-binding protein
MSWRCKSVSVNANCVGEPLQLWMNRLRLHDAWPWLLAGEPVKAVAFRLRFKQASHFSASFKRAYGISPSTCRSLPDDNGTRTGELARMSAR